MFTTIKRIFRSGWLSFKRNGGLSIATIFIMVMAISLITSLFFFQKVTKFLISSIEEKVDISVYFKKNSQEEDILEIRDEVSKIPEVKDVEYLSQEEVLARFRERHKENPLLIESLAEVGNPFLAVLNIKAWQASQYEKVSNFLANGQFQNVIEKVDYYQRKPIIEKLFLMTSTVNKVGIGASIIFSILSILIAFNTIRLAIFNLREEIKIMRLVGASNWFIRGPFLIQGIIAGFFATLISLLFFSLLCYFLTPKVEAFIPGVNLFSYFVNNFWNLFLIQTLTGFGLGIISSFIAIRRYLEV